MTRDHCHLSGTALGNNESAVISTLGAKVNDPVRTPEDIRLCSMITTVFPQVCQPVQYFQQVPHILEVEACSRFIQDIESPARRASAQFPGKLYALGFSP